MEVGIGGERWTHRSACADPRLCRGSPTPKALHECRCGGGELVSDSGSSPDKRGSVTVRPPMTADYSIR